MALTGSDLWKRTHAAVQARFADFALIAGAFAFLPNVAVTRFAPENPFALLAVALAGLVGQIVVVRIAMRPETDTGDALRGVTAVFLPALGLMLIVGIVTFIGFLALILPGLYLLGRFVTALPALLARGGGIESALRHSWALTDGKAVPIIAVAAAFVFMFLVSAFIAGGVGAVISGGTGTEGARVSLIGAVLVSAVAATFSVYYSVFQGTVWRVLTPGN